MEINWIWAFLAAIVSTIYFFLIKAFANEKKWYILGIVVILELIVIWLYYQSVKNSSSGIAYSIINGFSVLLGTGIAILLFKEKIAFLDILGIIAIVIGILLIRSRKGS
jgi:multidrug transporter EmrE-like cation transporter